MTIFPHRHGGSTSAPGDECPQYAIRESYSGAIVPIAIGTPPSNYIAAMAVAVFRVAAASQQAYPERIGYPAIAPVLNLPTRAIVASCLSI